ncbi:MAG: hypothetical protein BWX59_02089 [Bacteroidetes bacterium ADurb.Bin028]|nr:MAG: hypothetical protein BWX59_02089 [Bacteroidetes bacterium ADurb.Bin028]
MKQIILVLALFIANFVYSQVIVDKHDLKEIPIKSNDLNISKINIENLDKDIKVTLEMVENLPKQVENETVFVEWDIMIDQDMNSNSSNWGPVPFMTNDIGVDFMVGLMLIRSNFKSRLFDGKDQGEIPYQIDGNKIILKINKKQIKLTEKDIKFNFTVLTRKYVGNGQPNSLVYYDKSPEKGHYYYKFENGKNIIENK